MKRVYRWCKGCERRIDETLFVNDKCPGCIQDKEEAAMKPYKFIPYTEEEYEEMGKV